MRRLVELREQIVQELANNQQRVHLNFYNQAIDDESARVIADTIRGARVYSIDLA